MESKTVTFNLGPFPATVHTVARVRAAEMRITLKAYIARLILADATRASADRKTGS